MGIVITVTSGKGGTGKTSITGGVAASLALWARSEYCASTWTSACVIWTSLWA